MPDHPFLVSSDNQLRVALQRLGSRTVVGLDLETTGKDARRDTVLLAGIDEFVFPTAGPGYRVPLTALRPVVESRQTIKVIHNAAFDGAFFQARGVRPRRVVDTFIGAQLLKAGLVSPKGTFSLGHLLETCLGIQHDKSLQTTFIGRDALSYVPTQAERDYLYRDVRWLPALARYLGEQLREQGMEQVWRIENAFTQVIASMQVHGTPLDVEGYRPLVAQYETERERLAQQLSEQLTPALLTVRQRRYAADKAVWDEWNARYEEVKAAHEQRFPVVRQTHETCADEYCLHSPRDRRSQINTLNREWREANPAPLVRKLSLEPINPGSGKQLLPALAELGLALPNTKKESLILARATVPPALGAVVDNLIPFSGVKKLLEGYGPELLQRVDPGDGRLRAQYPQVKATGRISSGKWSDDARCSGCWKSTPPTGVTDKGELLFGPTCAHCGAEAVGVAWGWNSQNAHPEIKQFVQATTGRSFIIADYSQIELRVAAELILRQHPQADDALVRAFRDGLDPHSATAATVIGMEYGRFYDLAVVQEEPEYVSLRKAGKTTNFSTLFFVSAPTLAVRIYLARKDTRPFSQAHIDEAQRMIDAFWRLNPSLKPILDTYGQQALDRGYTETLAGRRRYYPRLHRGSAEWHAMAGKIRRRAANHPIQGTAADVAKLAGDVVLEEIGQGTAYPTAFIWNAVHDEVCVEGDENDEAALTTEVAQAALKAYSTFIKHVPGDVACGAHKQWKH